MIIIFGAYQIDADNADPFLVADAVFVQGKCLLRGIFS
jgi:hypothetical protein